MTSTASSYCAFSASMSAWRLSSLTAIFHQSWRSVASSVASSRVAPFLMPFGAAVATCFEQHFLEAREGGAVEDAALVVGVLLEPLLLLGLDGAGTVVDVDAVAVEHAHLDHRARQRPAAGGARCRARREAFSPKMARRSFSSGVIGLSPFGVILPTQDVARLDLGADVDDARPRRGCAALPRRRWGCRG